MTHSIIQKSQLGGKKRLDTEEWFQYIKPIYEKRKKLKDPVKDGFGLIYTIDYGDHERLKNLIEKSRKHVKNFAQIFSITPQLKNNDADDRIDDMVAELKCAGYLVDHGCSSITYQKGDVDFRCFKNELELFVEVKFVRGPDFKTQEPAYGAYRLLPDRLISVLERKYQEAVQQLKTQTEKGWIVLVTNLLEASKSWHGEAVGTWRINRKIKTVIITNGDIYE